MDPSGAASQPNKFVLAAVGNAKYPNYLADREQLAQCLIDFRDAAGAPKYMDLASAVARRETAVFPLDLDDLASHGQLHLAQRVCMNVVGFLEELYQVVDRLVTDAQQAMMHEQRRHGASSAATHALDTIDQLALDAAAAGGQPLPSLLTRRYELVIEPLSSLATPTLLRMLRGMMIGTLTVVRGICISATAVRPKLAMLTSVCELCAESTFQQVVGDRLTPLLVCPSQACKARNAVGRLLPQYKASKFVKFQELRLQELPEDVPRGAIPRTIRVVCEGEQTRVAAPGQVLRLVGTYCPDPSTGQGNEAFRASTMIRTLYRAFRVELEKRSYQEAAHDMQEAVEDARNFHDRDAFMDKLVRSIAPEIWGMEDVKKAMLCLLAGGSSVTQGGIKIRNDINILLMGDPGVAKSQLLKWVASTAPRSVFTTGKGSSGVGLTAAVTRDTHTGEVVLEGGALVLSDHGICCIDEFDKMEESDRTSLHEVMEQQSVSIAKAGIITTLNARTSILAASNPKFGRWRRSATPSENVNLPPALLSRFDLLWLLLDDADRERDTELSMHVTHVHLHGVAPGRSTAASSVHDTSSDYFSKEFLRAFIGEAKRVHPYVDANAAKSITAIYCEMRAQAQRQTNVVTARTLLSLIRISQASARLRLSERVTEVDVREAARLLDCSKASLNDNKIGGPGPARALSATDAGVFTMVKEVATGRSIVPLADLRLALTVKGVAEAQLQQCLATYSAVGVWVVEGNNLEFL